MNRAQLVEEIRKRLGKETSKAEAERALAATLDSIKAGVKKEKGVQLVGFGTFKQTTRKARTGRNPKTGEAMRIKASKTVKFLVGKSFKESL
ncbi:MAG: HU family DNA-binding protein [Verrucomicrobiia bacterium]